MTEFKKGILERSLGNKSHYRNRYCIGPNQDGYDTILELVESGHMKCNGPLQKERGSLIHFSVTEKGKRIAFN